MQYHRESRWLNQAVAALVIFLFFSCGHQVADSAVAQVTAPQQNRAAKKPARQANDSVDKAVRPNIVLIMADDMGFSDTGCYGGEIKTPHIDSLAKDGLRFTQFYNNAIRGPTRASLLTGLYCQQVGHRGDCWNEPKDFSKCVTIGEALQRAG